MSDAVPAARKGWLIVVAVALTAVVAASGWWGYRAYARQAALGLAQSGSFAEAAPLLEAELARSPNDAAVLEAMARGRLAQADSRAALPYLDRWCAARPNDPEPYRLRLDLHRKAKQYDAALKDGVHLLRLDPDNATLPFSVAGFCFSTGDFAQAEKRCRDVLKSQPKRRDARRLLAESLRAQRKFPEAGEILDALLKEKSDDTVVMLGRGSLYLEAGDAARAVPLLEDVVRLDPRRQRTGRHQLALAYAQAGRPADAQRVQGELRAMLEAEVLEEARDSQPDNPDVQTRAARAALDAGKVPQALELLGRVLDAHPDHAAAHGALAVYYQRVGDPTRAAEHRRRAEGPRRESP